MDFVKIIKYTWETQTYIRWLSFLAVVIIFYYFIRLLLVVKDEDPVFNFLDPIFGLITGLLAFALWLNDMKERWEDSLPKTLTVHFSYKKKYVLSCFEAYLSHQADIRNFGQQIGNQMNGGKNLSFYPFMHQLPRTLKRDKFNKPYWNYEIYFFLREDIVNGNKHYIWYENNFDNLSENKELVIEKRSEINMDNPFKL